jgi:hypothetical protein
LDYFSLTPQREDHANRRPLEDVAKQLMIETDPSKIMHLTEELLRLLEERTAKIREMNASAKS